MARTDIARMLTGIGGPAPVQAMPGTAGFAGQFGAQTTAGMGQAIGALTRGGAPSFEETVSQSMAQLDLTKVEDLAKLARMQQARGDLAGAAQTANKIAAIKERERLIVDNEAKKLLDEQNKTEREKVQANRWEAEQKLREERIAIERKKLEAQGPTGVRKMLDNDVKRVTAYETQAGLSLGNANAALNLADRYAALEPRGGVFGNALGTFKSIVGGQDEVSSLKSEFDRLVNTGIINSLPPGVASDKDIELIKKGFPDSSWNPQEIEKFLRAVAKISAFDSEKNRFRARYATERGGLETGFTDAWQKQINEPGYKEAVAKEYNFKYDIPAKSEVFDADILRSLKGEQTPLQDYGRQFSQPVIGTL